MITKKIFGKTQAGDTAYLFTLKNTSGTCVEITNFGGAIVSFTIMDKNGAPTDIVLGYDTLEHYEKQDKYIGAVIGRFSNRIENGVFTLNGKTYTLYCNEGKNHLHGGKTGFDKKLWEAEIEGEKLLLKYTSPDGEEGYPGALSVVVTYCLTADNCLQIDYKAEATEDTVCGLTNHSYFNLAGYNSGSVLNQYLQIFADTYTKTDSQSIPHGEIGSVENTPMDFTVPHRIGERIHSDFDQIKQANGYDSNWIIRDYDGSLKKAAKAWDENTGIVMEVATTLPGIQFYSGNFLDESLPGKQQAPLSKHQGFCLETQFFPNAMAVDSFLKPILKKGMQYHHQTTYQFSLL